MQSYPGGSESAVWGPNKEQNPGAIRSCFHGIQGLRFMCSPRTIFLYRGTTQEATQWSGHILEVMGISKTICKWSGVRVNSELRREEESGKEKHRTFQKLQTHAECEHTC